MDWSRHLKVRRAAQELRDGQVIAYPTEAVWGLGCDPFNEQAVYKLLAIKQRDFEKGLILVASDMKQLEPYLQPLSAQQRQLLKTTWPGPVTWLIPDLNHQIPQWIKGQYDSVAMRVSAHPLVAGLCRAFGGPIVSTSANPQGSQPALQPWQVHRYFGDSLAMVTPGVVGHQAKPTEIRDLLSGELVRAS